MDPNWNAEVAEAALAGFKRILMCGPCAVESRAQIDETAAFVSQCGVKVLRGGAFKPRTCPSSFQGVGAKGLEWLAEAARKYKLLTVSEILDATDLPLFQDTIDILQIGARNMQNFTLLRKVGQAHQPVLLKRGYMATVEEFLCAAEYIRREGNRKIILCERGIRTFEPQTRNTLDLSCIPLVQARVDAPIIVDLSNSLGRKDIVTPLARAALACGADGLMFEVHPAPARALCDGQQSLSFSEFTEMLDQIQRFVAVVDGVLH